MAEHSIPALFTYQLHVLKKQTDREMQDVFRQEIGMSLTDTRVLLSIGSGGSLSISDLGRISNLDRSQASRATDSLEKSGFVVKSSSADDGRGVLVALTPKGEKTCERASVLAAKRNEAILSKLTQSERSVLLSIMRKLIGID